jgi:predicted transcriptional regulator
LAHGPLGNYRIGDILGRSQCTISGAVSRLRTRGLVYDTDGTEIRPDSGRGENVWALGDDSVEWLTLRLASVQKHVTEVEADLAKAIARREGR